MTSRQPACASARASASPSPREAPVINAVRSCSFMHLFLVNRMGAMAQLWAFAVVLFFFLYVVFSPYGRKNNIQAERNLGLHLFSVMCWVWCDPWLCHYS